MTVKNLELEDITKGKFATESEKGDENVEICIYHELNTDPSYDLIFYLLKDDNVEDLIIKPQGEQLSPKELAVIKRHAENKIKTFTIAIRDFYNRKEDVRNAIKFFNPSISTFDKVILEEPDKAIKDLAYKAKWFYSMKLGIEPTPLELYYRIINAINEKVTKDLTSALEVAESSLEVAKKSQVTVTPTEVTEIHKKTAQKTESKVSIKRPELKHVKLGKRLIRRKFTSPTFEFRNAAMPVATALLSYIGTHGGFKIYEEYMKRKIRDTQQVTYDLQTITKIKKVAKNLEGKIFYSTKTDSTISTGTHNLASFLNYRSEKKKGKEERIKEFLKDITFTVKEMERPFSLPLDNCYGGSNDFGKKNRRFGDVVLYGPHTGIDFNGGKIIKAMATGVIVERGFDDVGGYYVKLFHGIVKSEERGLEFELINGEKFLVYTDSIKCIVTKYKKLPDGKVISYKDVIKKEPKFFDGLPVYSISCHIQKGGFLVSVGDTVGRRENIALKGRTGRVFGSAHLHQMVVISEYPVDPRPYISNDERETNNMSELYGALNSIKKIIDEREEKLPKFGFF